jgi:hypothetical protein
MDTDLWVAAPPLPLRIGDVGIRTSVFRLADGTR